MRITEIIDDDEPTTTTSTNNTNTISKSNDLTTKLQDLNLASNIHTNSTKRPLIIDVTPSTNTTTTTTPQKESIKALQVAAPSAEPNEIDINERNATELNNPKPNDQKEEPKFRFGWLGGGGGGGFKGFESRDVQALLFKW
jgi:hypothetical protein